MKVISVHPERAGRAGADVRRGRGAYARDAQRLTLSIISNSRLFREGVLTLLSRDLDFDVAGAYEGDISQCAPSTGPEEHIVLLDTSIGRAATLAWLSYWRVQSPHTRVVVMELANTPEQIVEYIERGAVGYTLRSAGVSDVADVVRQTQTGTASCSPEMIAYLFTHLANRQVDTSYAHDQEPLTPREHDVLECLTMNLSNKEIADRLLIEVRTVKHHVHNILAKLGLDHRWDAAAYARARGLRRTR